MTEQDSATTGTETTEQTTQEQQPYFVAQTKEEYERAFEPTRRDGRQALLSKLGVESVAEAERIVTEHRTAQEAAQTETQRLEAERDTLRSERDNALALADERLIGSELRNALLAKGVPAERIADALALTDRSNLSIGEDGAVTAASLEEAVSATLEPRDWLTGEASEQTTTRRAPDTTPQDPPKFDPANMTSEEISTLAERAMAGAKIPLP